MFGSNSPHDSERIADHRVRLAHPDSEIQLSISVLHFSYTFSNTFFYTLPRVPPLGPPSPDRRFAEPSGRTQAANVLACSSNPSSIRGALSPRAPYLPYQPHLKRARVAHPRQPVIIQSFFTTVNRLDSPFVRRLTRTATTSRRDAIAVSCRHAVGCLPPTSSEPPDVESRVVHPRRAPAPDTTNSRPSGPRMAL